jgi:hypothetical protein
VVLSGQLNQLLKTHTQRASPFARWWSDVRFARQNFPVSVQRRRQPFQGINDEPAFFVNQDQVAVLAHDFAPKCEPFPFAERRYVDEVKDNESVKVNLLCTHKSRLFKVAPQDIGEPLGFLVTFTLRFNGLTLPTDVSVTGVSRCDKPNFALALLLKEQSDGKRCNCLC